MDFFSKLMRHKVDESMQLLLDRFNQLIANYESAVTQN